MRHSPQALLGNERATHAAHAIGLVFNSRERAPEVGDKLALTFGKAGVGFAFIHVGSLFQCLECRGGIAGAVAVAVVDCFHQLVVEFLGSGDLVIYKLAELFELGIAVSFFFAHYLWY